MVFVVVNFKVFENFLVFLIKSYLRCGGGLLVWLFVFWSLKFWLKWWLGRRFIVIVEVLCFWYLGFLNFKDVGVWFWYGDVDFDGILWEWFNDDIGWVGVIVVVDNFWLLLLFRIVVVLIVVLCLVVDRNLFGWNFIWINFVGFCVRFLGW